MQFATSSRQTQPRPNLSRSPPSLNNTSPALSVNSAMSRSVAKMVFTSRQISNNRVGHWLRAGRALHGLRYPHQSCFLLRPRMQFHQACPDLPTSTSPAIAANRWYPAAPVRDISSANPWVGFTLFGEFGELFGFPAGAAFFEYAFQQLRTGFRWGVFGPPFGGECTSTAALQQRLAVLPQLFLRGLSSATPASR